MQLSVKAIQLLRHVLTYTGEKETDANGNERDAARRLNGVESSQRRHFYKNTEAVVNEYNDTVKAMFDENNKKNKANREQVMADNPKQENEEETVYTARVDALVNKVTNESINEMSKEIKALGEDQHEITLTPETLDVVKKYYAEFGEKTGFTAADDVVIEEVEEALQ